jgi:D-arabinose 1-dehydrogenase-like Zn-dependent alcohol dehydrogenase
MYPMVPGHKITGTVSEVGTKVTQYKVDDRVAVGNLVDSCRKCGSCHKGQVNDDGKISSLRFVLDPRALFEQGKR